MSRMTIIGRGRLGTVLATALGTGEPLARGEAAPADADVVLICVPDGEIEGVAATIPPGPLVGHTSGATPLSVLGERAAFGLHPLMTVAGPQTRLEGAGAAIAGTTPEALDVARELAERLGLVPFELDEDDRAAYHAAASIASNFLVTLEVAAERLSGLDRELLAPLVRATVENWAAMGDRALTGPIARGDEETVERQREAIEERAPELAPMFEALVDATRRMASAARSAA